ncbi:site-specific integrase [Stenotrophomonas maltophilia]|uniref:site-specific integrase n=1 Tax=Stenotrophomonas maltophilia TaxID=40324 RepID=UPI0019D4E263|nr:site-specific integrase [Stenotrophomonas maltophilia]MBN7915823.1 site-specific integrase [Stenotrophomonas maltophilia]
MATKRRRGDSWQYTIKRAGLLPQPVYLSFASEAEGDEYVRRLEALLDRGVVPEELASTKAAAKDLRSQVSEYRSAQHISVDDEQLLPVLLSRLPIGITLPQLTFTWATEWVTAMKREQNLAPSTIRHYVGALSRALDWLAAHGALPMNPLRLLPRGYSTYTADDKVAVKRIDGEAKADQERDRRLELGEEERIREILAGAKPPGRQRPLDLPQREALILMFDMALETAMRMREIYTLLRRVSSKLSRQFERIFVAGGCADLGFHDLRHEATSRLYERTSLTDIQIAKITGHRDPRQLKRYANLRASDLADQLW